MRDPWNDAELARRFTSQARTAMPRAPLNSALCAAVANDRSLHTLLGHAPTTRQHPILLLAVIHFLLLAEPDQALAGWYPNIAVDARNPLDPELGATLADFVHERSPAVLELLETRRVQTNEVGRCALFLPPMTTVAAGVGPIAHVDVGSSAGLTLLMSHFAYRYNEGPTIGQSRVRLDCSTSGSGTVPDAIPPIASAQGVDIDPIDITNPSDARWLQACCWPDQTDRFRRLANALAIAHQNPPGVRSGDAVELVGDLVEKAVHAGHPVVTTSWVMNYLDPSHRRRFMERLEELGTEIDLSWVLAESPDQTPELPHPADLAGKDITALSLVTWRAGARQVQPLGTCHPHGYWLHWR
ncbi:DUF2332 domain-containing protein [bacterium]|nr:DUF2332 domain-containing protein [bacterium]